MNVWDPFRDMEAVLDRYRPNQNRTINKHEDMASADWYPSVDVAESESAFHIHAELPGVKKDDIKIHVHEGLLTLSGQRESKKEETGKKFHRIERSYGSFSRSFRLPDNVEAENVEANFQDGVLEIDLHKSQKQAPKQIEVKVR